MSTRSSKRIESRSSVSEEKKKDSESADDTSSFSSPEKRRTTTPLSDSTGTVTSSPRVRYRVRPSIEAPMTKRREENAAAAEAKKALESGADTTFDDEESATEIAATDGEEVEKMETESTDDGEEDSQPPTEKMDEEPVLTKEGRRLRAKKKEVKEESDSSDTDWSEIEENLATLPDFDSNTKEALNCEDREECIWKAPEEFDEFMPGTDVYKYLCTASSRNIFADRALYILMKCNYDLKKATSEVRSRRLVKEKWDEQERELFKKAFSVYGKSFKKIHNTIPHKSYASLINYYYLRKSYENFKASAPVVDDEEQEESDDESVDNQFGPCDHCADKKSVSFYFGQYLCGNCMGIARLREHTELSTTASRKDENMVEVPVKRVHTVPTGMEDICESFQRMCTQISTEEFEELKKQEKEATNIKKATNGDSTNSDSDDDIQVIDEIVSPTYRHHLWSTFKEPPLRCEVEIRKALADITKVRTECEERERAIASRTSSIAILEIEIEHYRELVNKDVKERTRCSHKWSEEEKFAAYNGLIRYDCNFEAVSLVVVTKTPDMVKAYYQTIKAHIDEVVAKKRKLREEELVKLTSALEVE